MERKIMPIAQATEIIVQTIPGNLRIMGWDRQEVEAKTDGDVLDMITDEAGVIVSCDSDLILSVPKEASLKIDTANSDATLHNLTGTIEIGKVNGDLSLRHIGRVIVEKVEEELVLRHASDSVQISKIGSDASIRDVLGDVTLGSVGEDLHLRGIFGNVTATVGEDAVLFLTPQAGTEIRVTAGDDILLRLAKDADVELNLRAGSDKSIRIELPGVPDEEGNTRSVTLGSGATKVFLTAGDEVVVTQHADEWESLSDFDVEFNFGADRVSFSGMPEDFSERIARQIEAANRQVERAQERATAAARRAEQKIAAAVRRAEHKASRSERNAPRTNFKWSFSQGMGATQKEPVSDEERLTILHMLQEKKITAEEAEKLLAALE